MGAELGATTSVFPSDDTTREFLKAQGREDDFTEILPDEDAVYGKEIEVNLSELTPLVAKPHMPDKVVSVEEVKGTKVNQVAIGSCTNSSYADMMKVAKILKGKTVAENVSLVIAPGSRQVLTMLAKNGALADMVAAGARILESACGPCIGMGQSPCTDAVSLRTFNRNFEGRSGTKSANVYLVSPEIAAVSAIEGVISNPCDFDLDLDVEMPKEFLINDNMIMEPAESSSEVEVVRGPNIKPFPKNDALTDVIEKNVLIKVEDNITTDHIMPSNAKLLPYRSNIPYLSEYCLTPCDEEFPKRCKEQGGGFIVAGENYGQGSSREHAALAPVYLGIKAVMAKSFARIHRDNLVNNGILPLTFDNPSDYDTIDLNDTLVINNAIESVKEGKVTVSNKTKSLTYSLSLTVTDRQKDMLMAGGLLNMIREKNNK